jgi:hypothetical protein
MEYTQDIQMVLDSLNKDKRELLTKVNDIDKLIKKIKYGNLNLGLSKGAKGSKLIDEDIEEPVIQQSQGFPLKADLKVQVIKIMDLLEVASKLGDVRDKYKELTGHTVNLRETLRNLNKHQILKLIQPKGTMRGIYWIKAEWLEENGTKLKEQHKFEGFDLLYTDDMIEFK